MKTGKRAVGAAPSLKPKSGNLNLDELKKLPHFLVRWKFERDGIVYLEGTFEPPHEPSLVLGYLYVLAQEPPWDTLFTILWTSPDGCSSILNYHSNLDHKAISPGCALPSGKWDLRQLLLILDKATVWEERIFLSSDTWSYREAPGGRVTLSPGVAPPAGAEGVKKLPRGWDHEHCVFCWARISEDEEKTGFVGKNVFGNEDWACWKCYTTLVLPHTLNPGT